MAVFGHSMARPPPGRGHAERLAQIDYAPIPGRVGQRIRNELIFDSTGGGNPLPQLIVSRSSSRNRCCPRSLPIRARHWGQIYAIQASFRLIDMKSKDKKVVLQGTSNARAGFERFQSIYSNVRAREDAENRAARTVADDLKTRLAAYLSGASLSKGTGLRRAADLACRRP